MARALLLGICLIAGCGARSALEPGDGEPATGGSPGTGAGIPSDGGQAPVGGSGGEGPQGGEGPLCIPAVCDVGWEVTLTQSDLRGYAVGISTDTCGNIAVVSIDTDDDGVWVAQLDALGALKWARRVASYQAETAAGGIPLVAGTPSGEVIIAVPYEIGFWIDGVMVSNDAESDIALMRLDGAGNLEWVNAFGTAEMERPTALAVTPNEDILLGGKAQAGLDLGGGQLDDALFLARFSGAGEHLWSYRFAETGEGPAAFAPTSDGGFWALGRARRDVQFPGGPLFDGNNFQDRIFVARLAEDGSEMFSALYGDDGDLFLSSRGFNIAVKPDGGARFVAAMTGSVDFGGGEIEIGDPPLVNGVAAVELSSDGGFVAGAQLLVPVAWFTSAVGPDAVFLGQPGSVAEYGSSVSPVLSFEGDASPELSLIDGGLVAVRSEWSPETSWTVVTQLCDEGL